MVLVVGALLENAFDILDLLAEVGPEGVGDEAGLALIQDESAEVAVDRG